MTEQDALWMEALVDSGVVKTVPLHEPPVCCCGKPFEHDGVLYESVNAGCVIHGVRSHHVERAGESMRTRRCDTKRHTAHGVKE